MLYPFVTPTSLLRHLAQDRVDKFRRENKWGDPDYPAKYIGFLFEECLLWWLARQLIATRWVDKKTHDIEFLSRVGTLLAECKAMRQGRIGHPPGKDQINIKDALFDYQLVHLFLFGRINGDFSRVYLVGWCTRATFLEKCNRYKVGQVVTPSFTAAEPCRAISLKWLTPMEQLRDQLQLLSVDSPRLLSQPGL